MSELNELYSFMYSEFTSNDPKEDINFQKKMDFWENKIDAFCESYKKSYFSIQEIHEEFTHENLVPSPLKIVVQYLIEQGRIRLNYSLIPLNSPTTSVTDFLFNKLYTFLSSPKTIAEDTLCFYMPFLEKFCNSVRDKFIEEDSCEPFSDIITLSVLSNMCLRWKYDFSRKEFIGMVAYMQELDFIRIRNFENDTYIKFTYYSKNPVSHVDISACRLKCIVMREKYKLLDLQEIIKQSTKNILNMRSKMVAKQVLMRNFQKLKQLKDNEIKINDNIFMFESQLSSLHDTVLLSQVMTTAKSSIRALKDFKLSEEDIEVFDQTDKISQPFIDAMEIMKINQDGDAEDAQLQKELDMLIMQESIKTLPAVPISDLQSAPNNKIPLFDSN